MILEQEKIRECSPELQRAIEYYFKMNEKSKEILKKTAIEQKKELSKNNEENSYLKQRIKELEFRINTEFTNDDSLAAYAFSKIDPKTKEIFINCSKKEGFANVILEDTEYIFYLWKLGIDCKEYFQEFEPHVLADGRLWLSDSEHAALMKFCVHFKPKSDITKKAISYWEKNWKEHTKDGIKNVSQISFGLDSLIDFGQNTDSEIIQEHVKMISDYQNEDGSITKPDEDFWRYENTANAIISLSVVLGPQDEHVKKAREFLMETLRTNSFYTEEHWGNHSTLPSIFLALLITGDGPKISKTLMEAEVERMSHSKIEIKEELPWKAIEQITKTIGLDSKLAISVATLSAFEAYLKTWLIENDEFEHNTLKKKEFEELVRLISNNLRRRKISFEQKKLSDLIGKRHFRNMVLHELYEPQLSELNELINECNTFIKYLNRFRK